MRASLLESLDLLERVESIDPDDPLLSGVPGEALPLRGTPETGPTD
jgi:hypothetical protein